MKKKVLRNATAKSSGERVALKMLSSDEAYQKELENVKLAGKLFSNVLRFFICY